MERNHSEQLQDEARKRFLLESQLKESASMIALLENSKKVLESKVSNYEDVIADFRKSNDTLKNQIFDLVNNVKKYDKLFRETYTENIKLIKAHYCKVISLQIESSTVDQHHHISEANMISLLKNIIHDVTNLDVVILPFPVLEFLANLDGTYSRRATSPPPVGPVSADGGMARSKQNYYDYLNSRKLDTSEMATDPDISYLSHYDNRFVYSPNKQYSQPPAQPPDLNATTNTYYYREDPSIAHTYTSIRRIRPKSAGYTKRRAGSRRILPGPGVVYV